MITVSAVVLFDDQKRVLTVRKKGTAKWMLPGGKPEPGEDPITTAKRELVEELGVILEDTQLKALGCFHSTAANEGVPLVAHVFISEQRTEPKIGAELAEMRWVDPTKPDPEQAPLNTDLVFPLLVKSE